ncbi:MAG: ABC transporter ATP-binding protein [Hahellaceae bacterium]|nr:ABC transporter ATP-binding protein [Hahellaceae bacterium]
MKAVQLQAVQQWYGNMQVLWDLNLELAEGEVLGLFGHNGAGKTTTMKLILGLLRAGSGTVRVLGSEPSHPDVREQLGYLPENVIFYPQLTGRETLYHFARLKHAARKQADDLLSQVGLDSAAERRVKTYSKGMRQRLGLAQALLGAPRLLLLDEPTVGLDPIATQDLYQLVDQLRQRGTSIILCSHVLPGVEPHIDRAAILTQGRMRAIGTLAELRRAADLPVRIRALGQGMSEFESQYRQHGGYTRRNLTHQGIEVSVRADKKLPVLREMLSQDGLTDIDIQQPSLEELYRFFMEKSPHDWEKPTLDSEEISSDSEKSSLNSELSSVDAPTGGVLV